MKIKKFIYILLIISILVLGIVLYNKFDSANQNTSAIVTESAPQEQIASTTVPQDESATSSDAIAEQIEIVGVNQTIFDEEYADVEYIKDEVQQEELIDKIIFPDITECPICLVEPIDIDSDFWIDFAFHGDLSDVKIYLKDTDVVEASKTSEYGGNYTGRADYESPVTGLAYNKKIGSISIFYYNVLRGETSETIVQDDIQGYIQYANDYMSGFEFTYDKNSVWIGDKNKNDEELRKLTFEYQLNGINFYPGSFEFKKYNMFSVAPTLEVKINTYGIGYYCLERLCKVKEILQTDVELITFNKAYEIFKSGSTEEFTYAKFYYCLDVADENHFCEVTVDGDTFNAYQSFEYKTLPVWIFFTGEKYDRDVLGSLTGDRIIIDAQTGEIIDK